jgi:hypothetical protein
MIVHLRRCCASKCRPLGRCDSKTINLRFLQYDVKGCLKRNNQCVIRQPHITQASNIAVEVRGHMTVLRVHKAA